jgi:hypothetical protein
MKQSLGMWGRVSACAGLAGLALLSTGCPNPNTYGTPRTTPVGRVQHTIAAEGVNYRLQDSPQQGGERASVTFPTFPTYQLRVGVADRVDIGARIMNFSSIGADVKWNFLKTDAFDMAIVPGFQLFHLSGTTAGTTEGYTQIYGHAPLVLGINVADEVSIVPTLGVTYGYNSASFVTDDRSAASSIDGVILRAGLGVNFRVMPKFALHPEVTMLEFLNAADEPKVRLFIFGLGFNFGNLPTYGTATEAE